MNTAAKLDRDKKRDDDHKYKWANGVRNAHVPGARPRPFPEGTSSRGRFGIDPDPTPRRCPRLLADMANVGKGNLSEQLALTSADADAILGNDEWCCERCNASLAPDAGITYSFDRGSPSDGYGILAQALDNAVERFEDKKIKTLVRDEYDLVSANGDEDPQPKHIEGDFEWVDAFE